MPIKPSAMARVNSRIEKQMPPRALSINRDGTTLSAKGYIKPSGSDVAIDNLGFRDQDGILYVAAGSLQLGDEVDGVYVLWDSYPSEHYASFIVRKIPPWASWTRKRSSSSGTDPDTLEPILVNSSLEIDAHLARLTPGSDAELSGMDRTHTGILITKSGNLEPMDRVDSSAHGSYSVFAVTPYGPYERAFLEAA